MSLPAFSLRLPSVMSLITSIYQGRPAEISLTDPPTIDAHGRPGSFFSEGLLQVGNAWDVFHLE